MLFLQVRMSDEYACVTTVQCKIALQELSLTPQYVNDHFLIMWSHITLRDGAKKCVFTLVSLDRRGCLPKQCTNVAVLGLCFRDYIHMVHRPVLQCVCSQSHCCIVR